MAWFWTIIQLLIRLLASFWIYGGKISLGFWFEIEGLNQRISYWKLRKIISRVYQVIKNSFQGGFMACFLTSIQLLIHSSASFLELRYQNVAYNLIRNWRIESRDILLKLGTVFFQGCFKSYRIAFRVALWLDFEQLSSYLFISRCLFRAAISKCYMEFDTKLEDWINRYLIQTYHRLSQEYFKSYRITFRMALWLVFK